MVQTVLNIVMSSLLTTLSMPGYLFGGIVFFSLIPLFFALEKKGPILSAISGFSIFFHFLFCEFSLFNKHSNNWST